MQSRFFKFILITLVMSVLSGCAIPAKKNETGESSYNYDKSLKQCINESDYLAKKNRSQYGKTNEALIQMLSGIKSYSTTQFDQIDEKNKEIITSMYMYQVNDLCNNISQSYLIEVKKDLNSIVDKTK